MIKQKHVLILIFFLFSFSGKAVAIAKSPMRILLISGKNNHEWQKTNPCFEQIMEENGYYKVDLTERSDTQESVDLKKYDVLASNWNAFPETTRQWGGIAEKAILDFVNRGGGFVLFHSASAAHYNWPEYQNMVGATWGKNTRHGKITSFEVKIEDTNHPVTKGMSNFIIADELWVEMDRQEGNHLICSAFSTPENSGRAMDEPIAICRKQGKGRCFYLVLGHNVVAMQNLGWKTLMLRGAEWAASGKVTIPVPDELKAN
ncbi:ThuA domain-containing protein [Sunxiuqinia sp. sy24]|uniref:ThuA domain-containing protein n=1 Tax=Sunxiuqinia sp. sy24 TaxID=3461495 RepID=UPI004046495E